MRLSKRKRRRKSKLKHNKIVWAWFYCVIYSLTNRTHSRNFECLQVDYSQRKHQPHSLPVHSTGISVFYRCDEETLNSMTYNHYRNSRTKPYAALTAIHVRELWQCSMRICSLNQVQTAPFTPTCPFSTLTLLCTQIKIRGASVDFEEYGIRHIHILLLAIRSGPKHGKSQDNWTPITTCASNSFLCKYLNLLLEFIC